MEEEDSSFLGKLLLELMLLNLVGMNTLMLAGWIPDTTFYILHLENMKIHLISRPRILMSMMFL